MASTRNHHRPSCPRRGLLDPSADAKASPAPNTHLRSKLILLLALASCSTEYAEQPALITKGANEKRVNVFFYDVATLEELRTQCVFVANPAATGACSLYSPGKGDEPAQLIVISIPPKDFNDRDGLAFLGHEVLHGRGWKHLPAP